MSKFVNRKNLKVVRLLLNNEKLGSRVKSEKSPGRSMSSSDSPNMEDTKHMSMASSAGGDADKVVVVVVVAASAPVIELRSHSSNKWVDRNMDG